MKIGFDFVGVTTPFYCIDEAGYLLMHKRTTECRDEHNRWDTRSGKLEFGLSLEENVLKEVLEEYGCKGEILDQLPAHDIFREQEGKKTHWIAVPFFVRVNRGEVKNNEPHKIEELSWFELDKLPKPLHSGFEHTLKRYRHVFEKNIKCG